MCKQDSVLILSTLEVYPLLNFSVSFKRGINPHCEGRVYYNFFKLRY